MSPLKLLKVGFMEMTKKKVCIGFRKECPPDYKVAFDPRFTRKTAGREKEKKRKTLFDSLLLAADAGEKLLRSSG